MHEVTCLQCCCADRSVSSKFLYNYKLFCQFFHILPFSIQTYCKWLTEVSVLCCCVLLNASQPLYCEEYYPDLNRMKLFYNMSPKSITRNTWHGGRVNGFNQLTCHTEELKKRLHKSLLTPPAPHQHHHHHHLSLPSAL